jgi:hypothetical protein
MRYWITAAGTDKSRTLFAETPLQAAAMAVASGTFGDDQTLFVHWNVRRNRNRDFIASELLEVSADRRLEQPAPAVEVVAAAAPEAPAPVQVDNTPGVPGPEPALPA